MTNTGDICITLPRRHFFRWVAACDVNLEDVPAEVEVFVFREPATVDVIAVAGGQEVEWRSPPPPC